MAKGIGVEWSLGLDSEGLVAQFDESEEVHFLGHFDFLGLLVVEL